MSGVFISASHQVLQYFTDDVTHEQTGCAHLSAFAAAISSSLLSDQRVMQILNTGGKRVCSKWNTGLYKKTHIVILVSCFTHQHVSIEAGMISVLPFMAKA
jgi:D-serine deaminase-like pyridoxal phosphate-dependent protein